MVTAYQGFRLEKTFKVILSLLHTQYGHDAPEPLFSSSNLNVNPYKPGVLFIGHRQANRIAPDVKPQNPASHLGLFCLLTRFSSKNEIKMKKHS